MALSDMRKRVALIRPLAGSDQTELQEPLGAEALCGYLRLYGVECRVFDRQIDRLVNRKTLAAVQSYAPTHIGFSVMTVEEAQDAAQMLLMLQGTAKFCVGGLFVTTNDALAAAIFPKDTLLIRGEGEAAILQWVMGEPQSPVSPDGWAFASRDEAQLYLERGGVLNLRTSAGCPGCCTFCATPVLPNGENHWRGRDLELIADEMEQLSKRFPPVFNFVDDHFGSTARIEELIELLQKRKLRAAFSLELRAQSLISADLQTLKALHSGGLCRIFVGLESLDGQTQRGWGKIIDSEALLAAIDRCREAEIEVALGYILWHRDSTPASVLAEMKTLHQHGLLSVKTVFSRLILFSGTRRTDETIRVPTEEPLTPQAQALYTKLTGRLAALYPLWTAAASVLPGAVCRDWLDHTQTAAPLRELLREMDDAVAEAVFSDSELPESTIRHLEERTHALCTADFGG